MAAKSQVGFPDSLKVGAFKIRMIWRVPAGKDRWGEFDDHGPFYVIDPKTPESLRNNVHLHEFNHSLWWAAGLGRLIGEERAVEAFTNGLIAALQDNKQFRRWFRDAFCED